MEKLPKDSIILILSNCSKKQRKKLRLVCKRFNEIITRAFPFVLAVGYDNQRWFLKEFSRDTPEAPMSYIQGLRFTNVHNFWQHHTDEVIDIIRKRNFK